MCRKECQLSHKKFCENEFATYASKKVKKNCQKMVLFPNNVFYMMTS